MLTLTESVRRSLSFASLIALLAAALLLAGAVPASAYIPPLQKVDQDGQQLEGATFEYQWCTKFNNDPDWTCLDFPAPDGVTFGWTDHLNEELDSDWDGRPDATATQVITIRELDAPDGYRPDREPRSWTMVCGAWRPGAPGDADLRQQQGARWIDWRVVQCDGQPASTPTNRLPMQIVNERLVPVLDGHDQLPRLQKLDQDGNPLLGATVTGYSCTAWANDLNFQCQDLGDFDAIDPQAEPGWLRDTIPSRLPTLGSEVPASYRAGHRLVMWERTAPDGYRRSDRLYAVDWACGAWRWIGLGEVTGDVEQDVAAITEIPEATCGSPVLKDNTFTWVNAKQVTGTVTTPGETTTVTTPGPTVTQVTPAQTVTVASGQPTTTPTTPTTTPPPVRGASATRTSLSIRKTANRARVTARRTITYRLVVSAGRTADATGVTVCDPLPSGLTYVRVRGARITRGTACWRIARLKRGTSRTLTVIARAQATAISRRIKNTAMVSAANAASRTASATVTVRPSSILAAPGGVTG